LKTEIREMSIPNFEREREVSVLWSHTHDVPSQTPADGVWVQTHLQDQGMGVLSPKQGFIRGEGGRLPSHCKREKDFPTGSTQGNG
jgi:hypothetical protein